MARFSSHALLSAALLVLGSPLPAAPAESAGTLSLELRRSPAAAGQGRRLGRRGDLEVPINSTEFTWVTGLQAGTPPQSFQVVLDTGSSDLWLWAKNTTGSYGGEYDGAASSTYGLVKKDGFSIQYAKGGASGDVVQDTVAVGTGASAIAFENFTFATVSASSASNFGVLGIDFAGSEVISPEYPNLPQRLKNSGAIARNAYSLYGGSSVDPKGNILFGGIDTAKYEGKLQAVALGGQSFQIDYTYNGRTYQGVVDSGTNAIVIPGIAFDHAVADIRAAVPTLQRSDVYYVNSLSEVPEDKSLTLTIGGTDYALPLRSLFGQSGDDPTDVWSLEVFRAGGSYTGTYSLLGDPFFRAIYVVHDLDGEQLALAPAKYSDETNIVPIPADGIPSYLLQ